MRKHRYEQLLQILSKMAREPLANGSFQVSRLQSLKTLFRDLESYLEFVFMILAEVQSEVEKSAWSPLLPLGDKIRLFERVREAIEDYTGEDNEELKKLTQELFDLQPGWKRTFTHNHRRRGREHHLLLLEYVAESFVRGRDLGFHMVYMYLAAFEGGKFIFAPDAPEKLLRIRNFWEKHPPQFTVKIPRPPRVNNDSRGETKRTGIKELSQRPIIVRSGPIISLPHGYPLVPLPDDSNARIAEEIRQGTRKYQKGEWVLHEVFGHGLVISDEDDKRIVLVKFKFCGVKKIFAGVLVMWPIPHPDDIDLEPSKPSRVVVQVLGKKLESAADAVDADDLEEMTDPAAVKLAKAAFNLAKAKQHFDRFVKSAGNTMCYVAGDELNDTITRLKGAKNRTCEAWLIRDGYTPSEYDDRYTLEGAFYIRAPRPLLRKAINLEEKLTLLFYGNVFTDGVYDGAMSKSEERLEEIAFCLLEVEALYQHVKNGREIGAFRWERENNFAPGQWVHRLSERPLMQRGNPWLITDKLVIAVQGNEVIVRTPYRRKLERLFIDTLFLRPSLQLPKDMNTPFEIRRTWFDLRPQLRQVPVSLPNYRNMGETLHYAHDFGASLYYTCPCCGYPTMLTHPEYHCVHFDDDYDYSEICILCDWADVVYNDDGFDENDPDDENFNYSLLRARQNFENHGSIFQPADGIYFDCHHSQDIFAAKQKLRSTFDAMVGEGNKGRQFILWWQAEEARQELIAEMKSFENAHPEAYAIRRDSEGEVVGRRFDYKWRKLMSIRPGDYVDDIMDHGSFIVALWQTSHGQVVMLRNYRRNLRPSTLGGDRRILERSLKSFWRPFFMRRTWFEAHSEYLKGLKPCPCCGYPLMTGERSFEWCSLCCWEDDGQDDHNADEVLGGPNADLSLTEARRNFELTLCAFRPGDPEIESLAICRPVHLPWKQRLLGLYDRLIIVESVAVAGALWEEIESCWEEFRSRD